MRSVKPQGGIEPPLGAQTVSEALRRRSLDPRPWFGVCLGLLLLGFILVWPPVWHLLGA